MGRHRRDAARLSSPKPLATWIMKTDLRVRRKWSIAVALCVLLVLRSMTWADDAVTPEKIARAILELGDSSFAVRERASRFLWSAGKSAELALKDAAKGDDPEIAARAKDILGDITYGISPHTPKEVATIVRSYRNGEMDRQQL